jgi:hypothetical protein
VPSEAPTPHRSEGFWDLLDDLDLSSLYDESTDEVSSRDIAIDFGHDNEELSLPTVTPPRPDIENEVSYLQAGDSPLEHWAFFQD